VDHRFRAPRHRGPVRRHRPERDRPDGLARDERVDELDRAVPRHQRVEGQRLLQHRGRGDVAPDLLEQQRQLDDAEAQTPSVLGHGEGRPTLFDHR
jgi:hypothetical protein